MLKTLVGSILLLLLAGPSFAQKSDWPVTKTEWSEADEIGFGEFIKALAKTKCQNVDECMRSEANPYRQSDPKNVKFWSDCADWPYFLRAYYAWKNQLPFSYVSEITSWDSSRVQVTSQQVRVERPWYEGGGYEYQTREVVKRVSTDLRYSDSGNYPLRRRRVAPSTDGARVSFLDAIDNMQNTISSGFFRFGPDLNVDGVAPDFYPVDINTDAVRPGAVAYSPLGHVSIVYDVTPDGRVLLFNAHPADRRKPGGGTPVSRTTFETRKEYVRSRPGHGSGLKQWRPFRLAGAKWKKDRYVGGSFVFADNYDLPNYSRVQFDGNTAGLHGIAGKFQIRGKTVPYENYVRLRLATVKLDPLLDFERRLAEACELMKGRVAAVQDAVNAGLHKKAHPKTLPRNIFSADGEWEDYSSPSRDVRLRSIFFNLRVDLLDQVASIRAGDSSVVRRPNLRQELLAAYKATARSCAITYKNSAGRSVTLGFDDLIGRLSAISFDPYHCPERRWGATSSEELATCKDDANKKAWYSAEQIIRNHLEKDWKASGPIDLTSLQKGRIGFGSPEKPNLDVKSLIERLPEQL